MTSGQNTKLRLSVDEILALLNPIIPVKAPRRFHHSASHPRDSSHVQQSQRMAKPLVIGLTGLQGSGKSTWARMLVETLREQHGLNAISVSLDDFYLPHDELVRLRREAPCNKLLRTRGQPGTHDELLARKFFAALREGQPGESVEVPFFDKSCFNGEGDRAPQSTWERAVLPVDVVVFEGWCVGFTALQEEEVVKKHAQSQARLSTSGTSSNDRRTSTNTLGDHEFEHLLMLNKALDRYVESFMGPQHFDCLIHLDTDDLSNVFNWRLDQEKAMLAKVGCGMSETSVYEFVKGYMPAYELYLDALRTGFFASACGKGKPHVHIVLDKQRVVVKCTRL